MDGGGTLSLLTLINNIWGKTEYGIFRSGGLTGSAALNPHADVWQFEKNCMVLDPIGGYPANNFYPTNNAALGLDASYRPSVASGLRAAGTDGLDVGILVSELEVATTGVIQGYFDYATR
jgi:hypothetical protein